MRFLGVTETCDLGALYMRLLEGGHEVRISISDPLARGTLAGLVPHVPDWRAELNWVRAAGAAGVIVFEAVSEGLGALQDTLRREGFNVIGGSEYGDRLENDRAFAQGILGELGMQVAPTCEFDNFADADAYLRRRPRRYVLKFSGPNHASSNNYVGQLDDGSDVRAVLAARVSSDCRDFRFVLMDYVEGFEMGVGAYFDGEKFLSPACLDWEHKRFFAGDLGELTGEMGTVATFERSSKFFTKTLARVAPLLRSHGHVGYVNLNTIVNADGIWPLEFTCRFGYPGFAVLDPLQRTPWADLFAQIVSKGFDRFETADGFSVGIVLTTPPFPYSRKQIDEPVGLPILLSDQLEAGDRRHLHFGEMGMSGGQLATSGLYGWTMVITGEAATISDARRAAYERIGRVTIPNMRYRLDIGERLALSDYARIDALGLLD